MNGQLSIYSVIMMVMVVIIFGALIGTVADNTIGIADTGNVTGVTSTLLVLVPAFMVIAIIMGFVKNVGGRRREGE